MRSEVKEEARATFCTESTLVYASSLSYPSEAVSLDSPEEEGDELFRIKEHKKSCRSLDFSMDGSGEVA